MGSGAALHADENDRAFGVHGASMKDVLADIMPMVAMTSLLIAIMIVSSE